MAGANPPPPLLQRRILIDSPTSMPALGFAGIGLAFATVIGQSEARFAVGIFGGWGSGKTTLMNAIKAALPVHDVIAVDFNAWRFEREPQLLIPLLDTIRAALVDRAGRDPVSAPKYRSIAGRVGRVVRALAAGLSAEVGLPGAATVSYDVGAALDAFSSPAEPDHAQSLYVAAFQELEKAFSELSVNGQTRIVVFVDDLDRCLPGNALEVLESLKLFFDLPGFVFVVGLDESVVERAIAAKFGDAERAATHRGDRDNGAGTTPQTLGREYIKKIFQVPYSLPAMLPQQLDDLLRSMYTEAKLDPVQLGDLSTRVRPYLGYVAVERRVNPREVKRFINAYTLQMLVRPELDPDTVLALQTLAFRYDWSALYDAVLTDSELFADALRRYRLDPEGEALAFEDLASNLAELPPSLAAFLRSERAAALIRQPSLDTYLSSLQSYRTTGSWELEAFRLVGKLRTQIRVALGQNGELDGPARGVAALASETAGNLSGLLKTLTGGDSTGLSQALEQIRQTAAELSSLASSSGASPVRTSDQVFRDKLDDLRNATDRARQELQLLRDSSILQP